MAAIEESIDSEDDSEVASVPQASFIRNAGRRVLTFSATTVSRIRARFRRHKPVVLVFSSPLLMGDGPGVRAESTTLVAQATARPRTASVHSAPSRTLASASLSAGDNKRFYFYSPELNLISETATTTAATPPIAYDYLWFGGEPLAQINNATGEASYYFNDHLGTPILQTNQTAQVVWRAEYEPYGQVYSLRAGEGRHQPLRLPGQDAEQFESGPNGVTEQSYNIFRWYRAGWGRYTQSDPIGLRGGANLYRYVEDNPLRWTDPLGLKIYRCCREIQVSPVADFLARLAGKKHCFIKTDTLEAGMGPANGGALPTCPLGTDTATTPHNGQSRAAGTTCVEIKGVDEQCVNDAINPGQSTGKWSINNNCNTFADDVLSRCQPCLKRTRPPVLPNDDGRRYF